jgi:hypothetical protein
MQCDASFGSLSYGQFDFCLPNLDSTVTTPNEIFDIPSWSRERTGDHSDRTQTVGACHTDDSLDRFNSKMRLAHNATGAETLSTNLELWLDH